ncbi:MAG: acylphosphatase, partial [Planctomycetota bacterium]
NVQRDDLNPIDKGLAYKRLVAHLGTTQEEVARRMGLDLTGYVRNLENGAVELVLEGTAAEIDRAAGRVRAEMRANIDEEVQATSAATGEFPDMRVAR